MILTAFALLWSRPPIYIDASQNSRKMTCLQRWVAMNLTMLFDGKNSLIPSTLKMYCGQGLVVVVVGVMGVVVGIVVVDNVCGA